MTLDDIEIVLCRPSESGNVGAVCRAMKNMGLRHLRIVAPEQELDAEVILARAVHAGDIWGGARHFALLEEALADCQIAVGTTRRRGQRRKEASLPPRELAAELAGRPGRAALVFGNERTGLDSHELALCNLASHIPVDEAFPSLNLSHAVQIYAYELFTLPEAESKAPGREPPISREEREELVTLITGTLRESGFYRQSGSEYQEAFFHDILARAALSATEAKYLKQIANKYAHLKGI